LFLFLAFVVTLNDVGDKLVFPTLVLPPVPALNAKLPDNLTISVSNGTVLVALAAPPPFGNTASLVEIVPPLVLNEIAWSEGADNVTKESDSLRLAAVVLATYKGLNRPVIEPDIL